VKSITSEINDCHNLPYRRYETVTKRLEAALNESKGTPDSRQMTFRGTEEVVAKDMLTNIKKIKKEITSRKYMSSADKMMGIPVFITTICSGENRAGIARERARTRFK